MHPTDRPDEVTLRFLAAPSDVTRGDEVPAGRVLEWIDKAGYACAARWSGTYCVTAYVGNARFVRTIRSGELVQVTARVILTGRSSMHVLVSVATADVVHADFVPATTCILILVAKDQDGNSIDVPPWGPKHELDRKLRAMARARVPIRARIRASMEEETYTSAGDAPRAHFRFLAAPGDVNWGGNVHGGVLMRWIDNVAYACAASWAGPSVRAIYSGGIHFYHPVRIGDVVELEARLIHVESNELHIAVQLRSGPVGTQRLMLNTRCMTIFTPTDGARVIPPPTSHPEDRRLAEHARELIALRAENPSIPRLVDAIAQPPVAVAPSSREPVTPPTTDTILVLGYN